jgi:hypothetical protein
LFDSAKLTELGLWPIIRTKWRNFAFIPFYVCVKMLQSDEI